jgi:hypothetical protein
MKPTLLFAACLFSIALFAREKKLILHPNGKVHYEYEMQGALLDGKFSCYYENGRLRMKGQFSNNQKMGLWRVWDEKGILRSERNYSGNEVFISLNEWDSTGTKQAGNRRIDGPCDFGDYLFSHRYLSSVSREPQENKSLFEENGAVYSLIRKAFNGKAIAFADEKLMFPRCASDFSCIDPEDITEVLIREDYSCCTSSQVMHNKLIAICPVVVKDGIKRELGWFAGESLAGETAFDAIRQHRCSSLILKTTVNDPSFRLKDVSAADNDALRLMLIEFEASAILYSQDNRLLVTNQ